MKKCICCCSIACTAVPLSLCLLIKCKTTVEEIVKESYVTFHKKIVLDCANTDESVLDFFLKKAFSFLHILSKCQVYIPWEVECDDFEYRHHCGRSEFLNI